MQMVTTKILYQHLGFHELAQVLLDNMYRHICESSEHVRLQFPTQHRCALRKTFGFAKCI